MCSGLVLDGVGGRSGRISYVSTWGKSRQARADQYRTLEGVHEFRLWLSRGGVVTSDMYIEKTNISVYLSIMGRCTMSTCTSKKDTIT